MTFLKRIGIFLLTNLLVMAAIGIIVNLLGIRMDGLWGLLILCALFGMGGSFISLLLSKSMAKWGYKVQIIKPGTTNPKAAYLLATIEGMANQQGIKTPEVGIYNSKDANAFATGASANNALIAFSSGIIDRLSEDELAAVAGHELSHITNGDMVTMTLLMGIVNTFVMFFARVIAFAIDNSLRGDNRGGGLGYFGYFIVVMLLQNGLMLLAYIPISAYSRMREFRADAGAASLTGAIPMIEALKKISQAYYPEKRSDSYAMAKISNRRKVSLFSTHPSMEARIERLQAIM
ncbi:MAG: protease HtpX [Candidatus Cloacimonetes bacterium HGW-Cloacimonetes-3]|jgi:heat shock protein HtpX|nr:MAG: protease HtpX [Candidatus Cloacimonetes bacterium HGW-Cloacimonetes-3]